MPLEGEKLEQGKGSVRSLEPSHQLLAGPYRTPRCRMGAFLTCRIRGRVSVVGLTDAPICWPIGQRGRTKAIVLCGDLVKALRVESAAAIMHWWGVKHHTVWKWRQALGVRQYTPGTRALHPDPDWLQAQDVRQRVLATIQSPESRERAAESKRGKPRPAHVREILTRANRGRQPSEEHRRKIGEANRRRGTRPPACKGPPWTEAEDELVRQLRPAEAAAQTGRTLTAVYSRRSDLGFARRHNLRGPGLT